MKYLQEKALDGFSWILERRNRCAFTWEWALSLGVRRDRRDAHVEKARALGVPGGYRGPESIAASKISLQSDVGLYSDASANIVLLRSPP